MPEYDFGVDFDRFGGRFREVKTSTRIGHTNTKRMLALFRASRKKDPKYDQTCPLKTPKIYSKSIKNDDKNTSEKNILVYLDFGRFWTQKGTQNRPWELESPLFFSICAPDVSQDALEATPDSILAPFWRVWGDFWSIFGAFWD